MSDAFISKYNVDGEKQWTKLLGTSFDDYAYALTTGSDGSIYIAGVTYGDLDGQSTKIDNEYLGYFESAFISKYNIEGEKQWTRLLEPYSEYGAEYGYIWSVKNKKWTMFDYRGNRKEL